MINGQSETNAIFEWTAYPQIGNPDPDAIVAADPAQYLARLHKLQDLRRSLLFEGVRLKVALIKAQRRVERLIKALGYAQ